MKIAIVGNGNVGSQLYKGFCETKNIEVHHFARRPNLPSQHPIEKFEKTTYDVIFLCINDSSLKEFINSKSEYQFNALWVHLSGATEMNIFSKHSITNFGVMYPVQTVRKNKLTEWNNTPLCIEASNQKSLKTLLNIANSLSKNVHEINSVQRLNIHLAAVLLNNFVNHLAKHAYGILEKAKIDQDILKPIILETMLKICEKPPDLIQTGPAMRNDHGVIDKHLGIINGDINLAEIYSVITKSIIDSRNENTL